MCVNSGSQVITVNSLPNVYAGGDINICSGDSIQLNATGALNYTWNTQITLTDSTIANPLVYPGFSTTYWVIGEDANGCEKKDTLSTFVSISPLAKITNTSPNDTLDLNMPNGGDIQFFSTSSINALSFYWDFGDSFTSTNPIPIHIYTGTGVFTVMLIAYNGGCADTTYTTITVIEPISIKENILDQKTSIFPNPAKDYINIGFKDLKNESIKISIYSTVGKLIKTMSVLSKSQVSINTKELVNGVYFIRLETLNNSITKRFTVAR